MRVQALRFAWLLLLALAASGCQCGRAPKESTHADPPIIPSAPTAKRAARPPESEQLWTRAESGEADDLARLARGEGGAGLVEGADDAHKRTALLALAYTKDFVGLPWAADIALGSDADLRLVAAESFAQAVSERDLHREPEGALELGETCKKWLAVGKSEKGDPKVRKLAGRGLRMLIDTRCVRAEDLAGVP